MSEIDRRNLACDMQGCSYVAFGRTEREAVSRMASHWTADDHEDHVRAILAGEECRDD